MTSVENDTVKALVAAINNLERELSSVKKRLAEAEERLAKLEFAEKSFFNSGRVGA